MTKNDGGSAFPKQESVCVGHDSQGDRIYEIQSTSGMTLRDHFAAKAMQAFISANVALLTSIPELSYQMADAMLKERDNG